MCLCPCVCCTCNVYFPLGDILNFSWIVYFVYFLVDILSLLSVILAFLDLYVASGIGPKGFRVVVRPSQLTFLNSRHVPFAYCP